MNEEAADKIRDELAAQVGPEDPWIAGQLEQAEMEMILRVLFEVTGEMPS